MPPSPSAPKGWLGLSWGSSGRIEVEPGTVQGDVAVIAGRTWLTSVSGQCDALVEPTVFDDYAHTAGRRYFPTCATCNSSNSRAARTYSTDKPLRAA